MICRKRLLFVPSAITSIPSMIGMPLRTNAAIWREKCMISESGTFCGVTSMSENERACFTRCTSRFWVNSSRRSAA